MSPSCVQPNYPTATVGDDTPQHRSSDIGSAASYEVVECGQQASRVLIRHQKPNPHDLVHRLVFLDEKDESESPTSLGTYVSQLLDASECNYLSVDKPSNDSGAEMVVWQDQTCSASYLPVIPNQEVLSRLDNLRESGDRYVYPGGKGPVDAAFDDARRFLEGLSELKFHPKISLVADGEINFSWENDDVYIDLGFYGDGKGGSYYAEDSSGRKYYRDSFHPDKLPSEVADLIT